MVLAAEEDHQPLTKTPSEGILDSATLARFAPLGTRGASGEQPSMIPELVLANILVNISSTNITEIVKKILFMVLGTQSQ